VTAHPPAQRLDALAAGDLDADAAAHLSDCSACRSYVEALRGGAREFAAGSSPAAFATAIAERATQTPAPVPKPRRPLRLAWSVAPALAIAAAVVLLLRARAPVSERGVESDRRAVAPDEPAVRFKGAPPLSVIRERNGRQERFAGKVGVRPGDGLRLELALDAQRSIAAGLLAEDGSWVELIPPKPLGAGTHFSELSARFDEHPTRGWLIAGEPAAVESARSSKQLEGLSLVRVEVEP
jgi:hypothetical protein